MYKVYVSIFKYFTIYSLLYNQYQVEMMLSIRKLKQQVQIGFFAPFFDVLQRNKIDIDKKQLMKN